eukprot:m.28649 g.28649  ORF g.28649 m.28649 type:complete len:562 (-) comp15951_c0_seq2:96-1781(-)
MFLIRLAFMSALCLRYSLSSCAFTASCTGDDQRKFFAPAWNSYDNLPDPKRGYDGNSCPVCEKNGNILPVGVASVQDSIDFNLTASVLNAMNVTSKHPAGYRTLLARFEGELKSDPRDNILPAGQTVCVNSKTKIPMFFSGPYWTHSAGVAKLRWEAFLELYQSMGGELDELVMDTEQGVSTWEISCNGWDWQTPNCSELMWDSIQNSKDFAPIEQLLKENNVTKNTTDPHWLSHKMNNCMGGAAHVWNSVMSNWTATLYTEMAVEPLTRLYPHARANQYGFYSQDPKLCVLDPGGYSACTVATYNGSIVGTHQTLSLYNTFPGNGALLIKDAGYTNYTHTAFSTFKYDGNRARMLAATGLPFKPWHGFQNMSKDTSGTGFYAETLLHTAVMGADDFLFFNPYCPACGPGAVTSSADNEMFSQLLMEVSDVVGCKRKQWLWAPPARVVPISEQALENTTFGGDWDDEYFLSGTVLQPSGTSIYRFTPNKTDTHTTPMSYVFQHTPDVVLHVPSAKVASGVLSLNFTRGSILTPDTTAAEFGLWISVPHNGHHVVVSEALSP